MFSARDAADYNLDVDGHEIASKWKGLLVAALKKVQCQVHPTLTATDEALQYVEGLVLRLLWTLCGGRPHSVQDVEDRVRRLFPNPIDLWAIKDAQAALERGRRRSSLVLPLDKIHPLLHKVLGYRLDLQVSQYMVAVLEYIAADILKLTGNYVKNIRHVEITCQDCRVAMCADKVLMDMFHGEDLAAAEEESLGTRPPSSYDEEVKDLISEERQHIRELNMIIKVFREPLDKLFPGSKDLDVIFGNVSEVYEFSVSLLGSFEDVVEMTDENQSPAIGSCFYEMAEYDEFDVYDDYAQTVVARSCRDTLAELLLKPDVASSLQTAGHGFLLAVKYVLPRLLVGPVAHCFQYFEAIKVLQQMAPTEEDRETLEQAEGLLRRLKAQLTRTCADKLPRKRPGEASLRMHSRDRRATALHKMKELQKAVDGWEGRDIGQCCNEYIMDGTLGKVGSGRRLTERHLFLFDGLVLLCKHSNKRSSVTGGPTPEYRLKECFFLRKVEILDREDTDELKFAFEIAPRDAPHIVLFAKNAEEKSNWMASLVMLNMRSMLERTLDSILSDEEKKHPLRLPENYRFSLEDSESQVVLEEKTNAGVPLIKGATLLKLVERLTYHMYADPMFVRTFLTTFRSFCQPHELLDLLSERFDIPEPQAPPLAEHGEGAEAEAARNLHRECLKRFRKEYSQPVQFRVLNVLRHWVDHHYYDFERDPTLLEKLRAFLDRVKGKNMRKWVESINKVIQRRSEQLDEPREITFGYSPPNIEWYLCSTPDKFDILTLHPIEIARQLTLLEFDLYRAVKPSELVNAAWTKKDKHKTSPNLLKMIHHSSNFSFWLERCIVETENYEERLAVVSRMLEVMLVLQELNNFTGVFAVSSAMSSACVHRLEHTFNSIKCSLKKALDEAFDLYSDHCRKYQEKLRSINPPCVPFLGMYLTNILHIEEGNLDFLPNHEGLINFSKRRKVAEITGEIQQYQNQPYCLTVQPEIRQFLENLNPQEDMTEKEFTDYLYSKSLEIEPRGCKQPPKFPRKWPDLPLKSPGIKPRLTRSAGSHQVLPNWGGAPPASEGEDATPPTSPSTPLTPPYVQHSDSCVFAPVLIGAALSPATTPSAPPSHPPPPPPPSNLPPLLPPPPLPPRKKRDSSTSSCDPSSPTGTAFFSDVPDQAPPLLPPREGPPQRDASPPPPPLPPRRDGGWTLPRTPPRTMPPPLDQHQPQRALSRRNSAHNGDLATLFVGPGPLLPRRDGPAVLSPPPLRPPPSSTPQLPPKTHRQPQLVVNHNSR
uniref:Son of sevenless n=2 Tax=Rhipicephalus TaxID=426455 RepID=A0A131YWM5_RHIAP